MYNQSNFYWDILTDKFNIARDSGMTGATKALRSWYLRKFNCDVANFEVRVTEGVPTEVELELEVPCKDIGIPPDLTDDKFFELTEGPGSEHFDTAGMRYIAELINVERHLSTWSMGLHPTDPNKVVINYTFN
jgi:hypothetical protein